MLENKYANLYQSNYYKQQVNRLQKRKNKIEWKDLEQKMALANIVYIESKNCISFANDKKNTYLLFRKESEIINSIIKQKEGILETLEEISFLEESLHPTTKITQLDIATSVYRKHQQNMQTKEDTKKRTSSLHHASSKG